MADISTLQQSLIGLRDLSTILTPPKSRKPIIRLDTTDPKPVSKPVTESTVFVVEAPAFGIGEFSLVLDNAIRTAHVYSTTPLKYGILSLDDFTNIVKESVKKQP